MDPLIINAAITGMIPMKKDTPHVPIHPDEIIADAKRCRDAGATIIHLHGKLRGTYSSTWSKERLDANGLLLLSSADQGLAEFERGRAAIKACRTLYFLGFGFNPKSISRLGDFTDASVVSSMEISGTHYGFTVREWNEIQSDLFPLGWNERPGWRSVHEFVLENQI